MEGRRGFVQNSKQQALVLALPANALQSWEQNCYLKRLADTSQSGIFYYKNDISMGFQMIPECLDG